MKKKLSLRNLALISVPILAAAAALLVFEFLPKDSQFLLEGSVEIASHTCYTKAGGTVESVLVQAGQQVHTGDVLAVIRDTVAALDSAEDERRALARRAHGEGVSVATIAHFAGVSTRTVYTLIGE